MISGINHITLAVSDLEQSFTFYRDDLQLKPLARWETGAYFLCGSTWLCLILDPKTRSGALPEYTHIAFTVAATDFAAMQSRLESLNVSVWKTNTSEGDSIYFLDPDGHKLEVHASDWQARIVSTKLKPYKNMQFFF